MDLNAVASILTAGRRPNQRCTEAMIASICSYASAGVKHEAIANAFGLKRPQTVADIVRRVSYRKTPKPAPKKGAPRRVSDRQARYLFRIARKRPHATWRDLCLACPRPSDGISRAVSEKTLKRAIQRMHLKK